VKSPEKRRRCCQRDGQQLSSDVSTALDTLAAAAAAERRHHESIPEQFADVVLVDARAQDIATLQQENEHLQAEVNRLQEQLQSISIVS